MRIRKPQSARSLDYARISLRSNRASLDDNSVVIPGQLRADDTSYKARWMRNAVTDVTSSVCGRTRLLWKFLVKTPCVPAGSGFDDFAAAQAGGADADAFGRALHFGVHRAQVDVPAALADVVSVADIVTELRAFTADLANLCHGMSPG